MADPIRHSATLAVRCPPEVLERVSEAAAARMTKPAEYIRQAIVDRLKADGTKPAFSPSVFSQAPHGGKQVFSNAPQKASEDAGGQS